MNKLVVASAVATAALVTLDQVERSNARLALLEHAPSVAPADLRPLREQLGLVRTELGALQRELSRDDRIERLSARMAQLSQALDASECALLTQDERLAIWEQRWLDRDPAAIDRDLAELRRGVERSALEVVRVEDATARIAADGLTRLDELGRKVGPLLARDTRVMWNELMGPVVQLAGDTTVGSGVLLESRPAADGNGFTTNLVTAWHVVRDIYGSADRTEMPVPVKQYAFDGSTRELTAHLLAHDVGLDVAVLVLDTREAIEFGARLAPRERCTALAIFDPIYAVGCPLGNDPIPTYGELASMRHVVDGGTYWMVSAPTYIGNSGGGIFDARTHELIGVFSKIYTHGSSRSTIVPHMGLATPLPLVYDWLEREGHAALLQPAAQSQAQTASARR